MNVVTKGLMPYFAKLESAAPAVLRTGSTLVSLVKHSETSPENTSHHKGSDLTDAGVDQAALFS